MKFINDTYTEDGLRLPMVHFTFIIQKKMKLVI